MNYAIACFTGGLGGHLFPIDETAQPSAHLGPWRHLTSPLLSAEHSGAIEGGILVGPHLRCHVVRELLKASVRLKKASRGLGVRVRASARAFNYRLRGRE